MPFRGEYHTLTGPVAESIRTPVYTVPDPSLPFLGVHVTRGIDGSVHVGLNAVLVDYRRRDVSPRDLRRMVAWPGLGGATALAHRPRRDAPILVTAEVCSRRRPTHARRPTVGLGTCPSRRACASR